ncbi:MAG: GTP-binding protein [Candidatus Lokiarchaeota archaeon]|nr:GTP-binding protein [Candidatus Lokiarchaeota archaeon]MBD3340355.1 GTP-binding protein [Candidatus Lokiarchaeota archaeon]
MVSRRLLFKTIVVGDGGVGKSTLIQRLITGKYIAQKITIGTDLATYDVSIDEETKIKLQIWDFAGEKRFRFFLPNYCRGALGCLLCYDITRFQSFKNLNEWYSIVTEHASDPVFILVGCKADLADEKRAVDYEQGREYKEEKNMFKFFESSSKTGENIKSIFEILTKGIVKKRHIEYE